MRSIVTRSLTPVRYSRLHVSPLRVCRGFAVLLVLPAALLALSAAPALAATWGIEMTHANAYGLQAASCPGGHESLPGEPLCGVDPYTGSGTTFARESGFNRYAITARNTASPALTAGSTLACKHGFWNRDESAFSYRWLRNGAVISGAEEEEYTLTAEDEGKAVQCEVLGLNASYTTSATTTALIVSPVPSTAPPSLTSEVTISEESAVVVVGTTQTCNAGEWSGSPVFSYQWLRNGTPIAGETSSSYTVTGEDAGTGVQCQVTGTNAGGSVAVDNIYPDVVKPEPSEESEFPANPQDNPEEGKPGPTLPNSAEVTGPVTVADQLPEGLTLADQIPTTGPGLQQEQAAVSGGGWTCTVASSAKGFTCFRTHPEEGLPAGGEYEPIIAHVVVGAEAADSLTNVAAVSGGGAATATASDLTTVTPAVPFGIQSFTTSVTEALGDPFTQAGGHPFAATATFVPNYTVSSLGRLRPAGGAAKDIETELPPGFIGDPQNVSAECTATQYQQAPPVCPLGARVGIIHVAVAEGGTIEAGRPQPFPSATRIEFVYRVRPAPGYAAAFAFTVAEGPTFVLNAKLRSDGDYGVTIGDDAAGTLTNLGVEALSLTFCSYGVTGTEVSGRATGAACAAPSGAAKPFLTNPTECTGPAPVTTLVADTYQQPADYVSKTVYTGTNLVEGAPSVTDSFVTGCNLLQFAPEVEFKPSSAAEGGTTQADEPTGMSFGLKVPQTNEVGVNATPELKNATVTLPEGMTVDPSAANGLQACSNAEFGLGSAVEPAEPASCPLASQIGTVKVTTPLLEKPLEGQVFLGEPECSPCSSADAEDGHIFRLFLQARSAERGVIVKLAGHVSANPTTGRLQATFTEQPQDPFSELLLTFTGGERASLANPQTCGTFTTTTDLTPWSTSGLGGLTGTEAIAGTADATPSSSFNVDWNGAGGACPASLPFSPSFSAGSQAPTAGASSPFSVTIGREDREQYLSGITVSTPPGLLGKIAGIPQCPEAQANSGTCSPESQIGTTTVGSGPGPHPFYLGGKVYLTGPYKGQPFGLSIVVPAIAGPFNLGTVVVRAAIAVNPTTAALTITSDPLPQYVDGVQLRLRTINVEVNRPGFMLNPTSCAQRAVGATLAAAQGAGSTLSSPFEVGGCQSLPFAPGLSASTQGKASKADGASLTVAVKSTAGQANIAKVDLALPKQLPSRLTTLQKACSEAQFAANPAGCPEGSDIGTATAITPILNAPLTGPAYLVSHGGAAFPDVEFVLQGEGVKIVLDGQTDIKDGITYSKFETVPDAPISSFETSLPEGPHSILGTDLPASANYSLCGQSLTMGTIITAQNGKQIKQTTKIALAGCSSSATGKPTVKITKTKPKGNTLIVTVKTSATGRVRISGAGLKTTTKKGVAAGTHQIKVPLTKTGKQAMQQHKKIKLRASLTVGKQAVAKTTSVKL